MKTTIPIKINLPVTCGIEKGQIETFHQEGHRKQIIDPDFDEAELLKVIRRLFIEHPEEIKAAIEESLESEREGI